LGGKQLASQAKKKKIINNKKNNNIGESKGGGIKKGIKKSIDEGTGGRPLFKKKRICCIIFLRRLRLRSFSPRLRNAVLPIKIIKLKKELIKNKIRIYSNTKRVRPKYANKIKYQNNIYIKKILKGKSYELNLKNK